MISSTAPLIATSSIVPRLAAVGPDRSVASPRWPVQLRVGVIVGGSAALWGAIFTFIWAI